MLSSCWTGWNPRVRTGVSGEETTRVRLEGPASAAAYVSSLSDTSFAPPARAEASPSGKDCVLFHKFLPKSFGGAAELLSRNERVRPKFEVAWATLNSGLSRLASRGVEEDAGRDREMSPDASES